MIEKNEAIIVFNNKNSQYLLMNNLSLDIIGYITEFIECDKEKCYLMMTCTWISGCNFRFNERIDFNNISQSIWFDYFVNIIAHDTVSFPLHITHLTFYNFFNKNIENKIPTTVTHLMFGSQFDQSIIGCIPSSVINLEFGYLFDQPIEDCIPSNVIHLKFGSHFNHTINNNIPDSITYLTLGCQFRPSLSGLSKLSVTHLTLCACHEKWKDIVKISSVTNLHFTGFIDKLKETQIMNGLIRDNLSITFE